VPSSFLHRLWRCNRQCSETSAYKIQKPGNQPKEINQNSEHGEILKSGSIILCLLNFITEFIQVTEGHEYFPWEPYFVQPCCTVCTSSAEEPWSVRGSSVCQKLQWVWMGYVRTDKEQRGCRNDGTRHSLLSQYFSLFHSRD